MKKLSIYLFATVLTFIAMSSFITGCGDDSGVTPTASGTGWPPTFNFKRGQTFVYTNDSIVNASGTFTVLPTHRASTDVVQDTTTVSSHVCYPFLGSTVDSNTQATTPDLYYVYYDAGKYYQYGIKQLINPSQAPTWDLIGDFTATRGTSYSIGSVSYTVPLPPPYNSGTFTGPLTGKIADSTTITTKLGETIYCYRIALNANIAATVSGIPITASIDLDYYVGYTSSDHPSNPVGLVELKLSPFSFNANATPFAYEPGYDRKLQNHNP